jgi:hypothetical protein
MAINPPGLYAPTQEDIEAQEYNQGQTQLGNTIGNILLNIPEMRKNKQVQKYWESKDLLNDQEMSTLGTLTDEWNQYKSNLEANRVRVSNEDYANFQGIYTLKKKEYDDNAINKVQLLKLQGATDLEIRKLVSTNPNLMLALYKQGDLQSKNWMPKKSFGEEWKDVGAGIKEQLKDKGRPSSAFGMAGLGAAGYGAYRAGKYFAPEATGKAAKALKATAKGLGKKVGAVGALYTINKGLGLGAKKISEASGIGEQGQKAMQEGTELMVTSTMLAIKKLGLPAILKEIVKKKGVSFAAKTLGKLGLGAVGGAASGGVITALMYTWAAKDLYDVGQVISEMMRK